jgi:uncharacterized membrane protein
MTLAKLTRRLIAAVLAAALVAAVPTAGAAAGPTAHAAKKKCKKHRKKCRKHPAPNPYSAGQPCDPNLAQAYAKYGFLCLPQPQPDGTSPYLLVPSLA